LKKILMLATGGTIASRQTEAGLTPVLTSEELMSYVPEVGGFCRFDTRQLLNLDSTNIQPEHWLLMERAIEDAWDKYDGFVICHGTDTMAFTAAALSYLIPDSPKPIVVTGAQKPIDMPVTDARTNLSDAFRYAVYPGARGVQIVFDGKVILGTRAKKTRTKSYNAFSSINYPYLAIIQDGRVLPYIERHGRAEPVFHRELDDKVALLKLIPGTSAEILSYMLEKCDAVVIESYGAGGVPYHEQYHFFDEIDKWEGQGKTIVMTTQVPNEGSDMTIYKVGHEIKERYGLIEAYDMTLEAAVTKLMWALALAKDRAGIKRLFYTPVDHDLLYPIDTEGNS